MIHDFKIFEKNTPNNRVFGVEECGSSHDYLAIAFIPLLSFEDAW